MKEMPRWRLSEEEKSRYIQLLVPNLTVLRTRAEISQAELAHLLGISRQTYSAIERRARPMSWHVYLALMLFFAKNSKTHEMLQLLQLFPRELAARLSGS